MPKTLAPKRTSESRVDRHAISLSPQNLNYRNTVQGAFILAKADEVGGDVAKKHSERECVTRRVDATDFLAPAYQGETLIFRAWINRSWTSSMEIEMEVYAEKLGKVLRRVTSPIYFTFVALNSRGKPTRVPEVLPETEDEKKRFEEAGRRRQRRLLIPDLG